MDIIDIIPSFRLDTQKERGFSVLYLDCRKVSREKERCLPPVLSIASVETDRITRSFHKREPSVFLIFGFRMCGSGYSYSLFPSPFSLSFDNPLFMAGLNNCIIE